MAQSAFIVTYSIISTVPGRLRSPRDTHSSKSHPCAWRSGEDAEGGAFKTLEVPQVLADTVRLLAFVHVIGKSRLSTSGKTMLRAVPGGMILLVVVFKSKQLES